MRSHLRREGKVDREGPTYGGRNVLVTGAGGSIGTELCRLIMSDNARRLTMVSLTEAGLYTVDRRLRQEFSRYRDTELVPVLGDYGDADLMDEHLVNVDLVIHAGAHKHVPICESNPLAAIANNVFATNRLMFEAGNAGVRQFVVISSDKAVNPTSVMGATKRVVELLARGMGRNWPDTRFVTVRFGNVADSAGSVMPLWREQIAAGGPVTLTDERCERFFMSITDAVGLITDVIRLEPDSGTFVLDMGEPHRLADIARQMIAKAGREIEIKITGLRPGEKVTEVLHHGGELVPTSVPKVFVVEDPGRSLDLKLFDRLQTQCVHRQKELALQSLWELVR